MAIKWRDIRKHHSPEVETKIQEYVRKHLETPLRPIENDEGFIARVEELFDLTSKEHTTPEEDDRIDDLTLLIEDFDDNNVYLPAPKANEDGEPV